MRLFLMWLIVSMHVCVFALGQNITLDKKNVPLATIIKEIKRQSGYNILYDAGALLGAPNVSVTVNNVSVAAVLDQCFEGLPLRYVIKNNNIIISKHVLVPGKEKVQNYEITGHVTDGQGQPLEGVTVTLKGTAVATTTNSEGNYQLTLPDNGGTLVFTIVGYEPKELSASTGRVINVSLKEQVSDLEEVVVVGYGTQRKQDLTGSVSSVGVEDIKDLAVPRVEQALQGKIAGVMVKPVSGEPGAPPQIRIRGIGSISASGSPLYVVDGLPTASIQSLNPNDIERIDVLKDASATAIYGSRGSNGVIIINTKRGKAGQTVISYDTYFGYQRASKIPKYQTGMEQAQHYFDGIKNANLDVGNDISGAPNQWAIPVPITIVELLEGRPTTQPGTTSDFQEHLDAILQTAPQMQHQLSASGGTENVRFAMSGEYMDQDGIMLNTNFKRYSLRANIDAKLTDKLSARLNFNPSFTDKTNVGNTGFDGASPNTDLLYNTIVIPTYYTLLNEDGTYFPFGDGLDAVVSSQNPLARAREIDNKQKAIGLLGNVGLEYQILDDLKFNVMLGLNLLSNKGMTFVPRLPSFFNNPAVGTDNAALSSNWLTEYTLNYTKNWGRHNFTGLAGYTVQKEVFESNNMSSNQYPNNLVPTLSAASLITTGSSNKYEWSLLSYLTRVNYNFDNKYYLTASIRADGSSRFGLENKYGIFPSAALAWRISEENFLQDVDDLNELKLRASYGETGNNNIGNYDQYATINYLLYSIGGTPTGGYAPSRFANPNLTWETQEQINLGIDVSLFNSRINLTVDHFRSKNKNLLLNVNVPSISGFSTALQNIGEVRNQGWEFVLNTVNFENEFRWSTDFNFSTFKNEVTKLGPKGDPIISGGNITMIGQPIGMFYGWLTDGIFMNEEELARGPIFNPGGRDATRMGDVRFVDLNGDGIINGLDRTIMGSPYPDFYYGMTNNFEYKNFSLSVSLQGVYGNDILALSRNQVANNRARFRQLAIMNDYWKSPEEPGDGKTPRPVDPPTGNWRGNYSQIWLDSGSYLRINNITLGYLFPETLANKLGLGSLRLYLNAINPFLFTDHVGWNPDVSAGADPLTPGRENYDYPLPKSLVAGLNITF
ncbi:SusC/RagA family TonB-linked outer membrane protein [Parapedobacter koreensis]|nr:TonB-dependent receptor [Parapedobacter koreensis]